MLRNEDDATQRERLDNFLDSYIVIHRQENVKY